MESPNFQIALRTEDDVRILTPSGRITLGQSVREMRQALDQIASEGNCWALLDMSHVAYMDSAGLGSIMMGLNLFRRLGGDLLLSSVQPRVIQLLEMTNLLGVLKIFPSADAALQQVSTTRPAISSAP